MKKKFLVFTLALAACLCASVTFAKSAQSDMIPAFSSETQAKNKIWVGTFQLVWNDFMDEVIKGPVKFENYESQDADALNKQEFKTSMLSESSYYTAWGRPNLDLKEKIESELMEKFGEKSEVLDKIDWNDPLKAYIFYAMLKKDFNFHVKFENLKKEQFNNDKKEIPYFGLDKKSPAYLFSGVDVLFYNNPFDYAVVLKSDNDQVILYRTNSNKSFDKIFAELQNKSQKYKGNKKFVTGDRLKVPYMALKQQKGFDTLCNKPIVGTDLYINQAIQTVDFKMTRRGVKLKSEAVLDVELMSMPLDNSKVRGRNFYFNKTFVIFLKETNRNVPYFAARVEDMDVYKYTGEID